MSKANTGVLLAGRRTHQDFHGYWPHQTDQPSPRCSTTPRSTSPQRRCGSRFHGATPPCSRATPPTIPTLGDTSADFAEHIRTEHSRFRWLLEPMLAVAGFEIVTADFERSVYGAYTCRRR